MATYGGIDTKRDAKWVRAESGVAYLCPAAILEFVDELTEEDLKKICVAETAFRDVN